ncbi:unnamed protein product [Meloidogyne enterolobii]
MAQCNICSTRYKTYLGCTTALKKHLKNAHQIHVPNVKENKGIQIRSNEEGTNVEAGDGGESKNIIAGDREGVPYVKAGDGEEAANVEGDGEEASDSDATVSDFN